MSTGPVENFLLPAVNPPKYSLFDLFPFSLLIRMLTKRGVDVKGKRAARMRARMGECRDGGSHNIPLEISLYLVRFFFSIVISDCHDLICMSLRALTSLPCSFARLLMRLRSVRLPPESLSFYVQLRIY